MGRMGLTGAAILLLGLAGASAANGTATTQVTVTLHRGGRVKPVLLKAPDGRLFQFSIANFDSFPDLTLFRLGHKPSATNLLEPSGHWHGIEPFGLVPGEFEPGEKSIFGRTRDIPVRNYPLKLHVEVVSAESTDAKDVTGFERTVFKTLVLTAELRPAK